MNGWTAVFSPPPNTAKYSNMKTEEPATPPNTRTRKQRTASTSDTNGTGVEGNSVPVAKAKLFSNCRGLKRKQ